jgi:ParB-like chromosome segregation protein Spo0J
MSEIRYEAPSLRPLGLLGTSLERVRCRRPALVERMQASLAAQGQLTAVVAVERGGKLEVVDGFKRLAAAKQLGWSDLAVRLTQADDAGLWSTMLSLNRGPHSMTELEEGLVLRELVQTGLTQVQAAQLVHRHKSWVSRRIGLVERLHPELVEGIRLGLVVAGVARRLLALPPGNQLEVAAASASAGLGPRDTELLVSLWQRAKDPEVRKALLVHPRASLQQAHPELHRPTVDPRLTVQGQQLARLLHVLTGAAQRAAGLLPPAQADRPLLARPLREASAAVSHLATVLGPSDSAESATASSASSATGTS